jgi:hypothetical protein
LIFISVAPINGVTDSVVRAALRATQGCHAALLTRVAQLGGFAHRALREYRFRTKEQGSNPP